MKTPDQWLKDVPNFVPDWHDITTYGEDRFFDGLKKWIEQIQQEAYEMAFMAFMKQTKGLPIPGTTNIDCCATGECKVTTETTNLQ